MEVRDPQDLLNLIDRGILEKYLGYSVSDIDPLVNQPEVCYSEPYGVDSASSDMETVTESVPADAKTRPMGSSVTANSKSMISGKVLRLGDFIDTDAVSVLDHPDSVIPVQLTDQIIPSKFLSTSTSDEELGSHCMEFFMPEFRQLVRDGHDVIVAGRAFGCGSSRDVAVNALLGAGVKCVIAQSFSFIYARNQPNIGLLGIRIDDDEFFAAASNGADILIDLADNTVTCGGKTWSFQLSEMAKQLTNIGGLTEAFRKHGKKLFDIMCGPSTTSLAGPPAGIRDIESLDINI